MPAGSFKITHAALAAATLGAQKLITRRKLWEAVAVHCPELATAVTDKLLERDNLELLAMLECAEDLKLGILPALRTAGGWKSGTATHGGSAAGGNPNLRRPTRTTAR